MRRAAVIGAGIGGLTAAVALRRRGWEVTVLERAARLEPVGAGLAIAANALKALDTLGLGDEVRGLASIQGTAGLRRWDGRWLTRTTEDRAAARFGDSVVLLRRATLTGMLLDRLPEGALRLGVTVESVADLRADLGADLVVAADGIHSAARRELFPGHPRPVYAGITAWRALVPRPAGVTLRTTESWGPGLVFGVMPMADEWVYLYATDTLPAGTVLADEKAELLRRFGHWHDPIPHLLEAADNARILRNDVYHLREPLPAMHRGTVALLGDAAHPMTPNLGQGACQAIEDAVVLAACADPEGHGLERYTAARLRRTAMVTARSAAICRITGWRNPLAVRLRDLGLSLAGRVSPDLLLRSQEPVLGWRPPAWAGSGREPGVPA
ncbi:FAD-dependent monooxygenase [Thermoactinospora rubra]|uniref:FAD-dependent monooxygenase n=1 Tax=Thermoactinospora rubra TaxID=1088767 RepID=UPI000A0F827C|nr:FAD-dependent monooxygenase [Thermoactinospora rubra]